MTQPPPQHITLYLRPGCHLCEDAAELLGRLGQRTALSVREVNILGDVDLYERYKHSIPVVAIEGGPTMAAPITAAALAQALGMPEEASHAAKNRLE